jgi:uncharacterized membrane protein
MRVRERVRNYMGWCPMTAAAQNGIKEQPAAATPETGDDAGPVTRRAVLYLRLTWIVIALSWLIAIASLPYLPQTVPVHWNMHGMADGFSARLLGAFSLPVITTIVAVFLMVLPRSGSIQESVSRLRDIYSIMIFATVSFLVAMEGIILLSSAGMDLPLVTLFPVLFGFLFIVIGSLLPHIGRNTTMGIRFPWTLRDEKVWKRTHEHGGPVFVIAGVVIVLGSPFAGIWALALMLAVIFVATLYIAIWSYRLAGNRTGNGEEKPC